MKTYEYAKYITSYKDKASVVAPEAIVFITKNSPGTTTSQRGVFDWLRKEMNYRNIEFPVSPVEREITIHGKQRIMHEIPLSMQRDWQIRAMVDRAVRCDENQIIQITKELQAEDLQALLGVGVTVKHPFESPSTKGLGDNNDELKEFCLDVYDALIPHFDREWFIAPYFQDGDDMHLSCELGVFATDNFAGTVVE